MCCSTPRPSTPPGWPALGVGHVLVCGSTGEAAMLTNDERGRLITAVRAALPSEVPVLAGTGAETAGAAVELTTQAGADGIVALSPPGSPWLVDYYTAVVHAAAGLPVLAYHFPAMSAPGIPVELLPDLPVAGLKDSTRDVARVRAEITGWSGSVFVGSTSMLELARALDAAGAILGLANAEPERCEAALAGDPDAQRALVAMTSDAAGAFPRGIKELTAARLRHERGFAPARLLIGTPARERAARPAAHPVSRP